MNKVMSGTPRGWPFASRPLAVLVASVQGSSGCAGDHPNCSAGVDDHRAGTEDDPCDVGVARHSLDGCCGDRRRELHVRRRRSRQSLECFERRRDLEVWALTRVLRHEPGIERMERQLDDRIALAMLQAAIVALAHRPRERLEGRPQGRAADRVQLTADLDRPVFPHAQLQASLLYRNAMFLLDALAVERMPQALAVMPEPSG